MDWMTSKCYMWGTEYLGSGLSGSKWSRGLHPKGLPCSCCSVRKNLKEGHLAFANGPTELSLWRSTATKRYLWDSCSHQKYVQRRREAGRQESLGGPILSGSDRNGDLWGRGGACMKCEMCWVGLKPTTSLESLHQAVGWQKGFRDVLSNFYISLSLLFMDLNVSLLLVYVGVCVHLSVSVCVCLWVHVHAHVCGCLRRPEQGTGLRGAGVVVMNHLMWVLETKRQPSVRGASTLNYQATSPAFIFIFEVRSLVIQSGFQLAVE